MVSFLRFFQTPWLVMTSKDDDNDGDDDCPVLTRERHRSAKAFPLTIHINKLIKCLVLLGSLYICTVQYVRIIKSTTLYQRAHDARVVVVPNSDNDPSSWKNIQYHSGVFKHPFSSQEHMISQLCDKLGGRHSRDNKIDVCEGALETNTTCCYCYITHNDEPLVYTNNYKYWTCAAPRDHGLMAPNQTRVDTNGSKVALVAAKIGHNGRFKNEVNEYCQAVQSIGLIEPHDTFCYWDSPGFALQNKKFGRHLRYRIDPHDMSARGGGYWFHKSVLLRYHMDHYKDGDFLVWTDTDRIDFFQFHSFKTVLETMAHQGGDLAIELMGNTRENAYTKADMLDAFNASTAVRESPQVLANVVVFRNSPTMRRLIDAWLECVADWHMVSDDPSVIPNAPNYNEHRHDQSILGLLIKSYMTIHGVVGPPARAYQPVSEILTYKFHDEADPACPFYSFYAAMFTSNKNKAV